MSKETYAQIMRESVHNVSPNDPDRKSLVHASFIGILEAIVGITDYTPAQKIAKIRNLNDARKEVLADE